MFAVTMGTDRGIRFASGGQFAVDAFPIIFLDTAVAFPTSLRDVEVIDR